MKFIEFIIFSSIVFAASADSWNYYNVSEWPDICQTGQIQSPIDLDDSKTDIRIYSQLNFKDYDVPNNATVKNNGHSVAIYLSAPNTPTLSGGGLMGSYVFDHFHFHWESEHTVNGERFPLEMHLVHYSSQYSNLSEASEYAGGVAVLGVFFERSIDDDEDFVPLIEVMNQVYQYPDRQTNLQRTIAARSFLPRNTGDYYRYIGSLTTPGCNEGVVWTVFTEPLPISSDQLEHFEGMWSANGPLTLNYRSVQPLNGRVISIRSIRSTRNGSPKSDCFKSDKMS